MRRGLWEVSSLARVRSCGRVTYTGGGPALRVSDDGDGGQVSGLAGLVTCGSPWACPGCAGRIGARRATEITDVIGAAAAEGAGAGLITLTLRHHAGQRLSTLWDGLRYGWSKVVSGAAYGAETHRFGIIGWVAVVEITHGDAGWHPHMHVLLIFDTPVSDDLLAELGGRWFARFERALARRGLSAVQDRGGLDARAVTMDPYGTDGIGPYLGKITHEITGGSVTKHGRGGNRTPFALLRNGIETGLADDLELWWEYEHASHGRRQVTYSRGLRERYRLDAAQTDEEAATEDHGTDDLIVLDGDTWAAVRPVAEHLLLAAERDGLRGAVRWLNTRGLTWTWARPARRRPPPGPRTTPGSRALLTDR